MLVRRALPSERRRHDVSKGYEAAGRTRWSLPLTSVRHETQIEAMEARLCCDPDPPTDTRKKLRPIDNNRRTKRSCDGSNKAPHAYRPSKLTPSLTWNPPQSVYNRSRDITCHFRNLALAVDGLMASPRALREAVQRLQAYPEEEEVFFCRDDGEEQGGADVPSQSAGERLLDLEEPAVEQQEDPDEILAGLDRAIAELRARREAGASSELSPARIEEPDRPETDEPEEEEGRCSPLPAAFRRADDDKVGWESCERCHNLKCCSADPVPSADGGFKKQ